MQQDADRRPMTDWAGLMHALGPNFAERAERCDANDTFVAENFAELKQRGVLAAGVPAELGGGGASYPELCEMLRVLAQYCGSTALTLSMHTHPLATIVWRWRRDPAPVERILRRVVDERLQLVTSGASDWLDGSGVARSVADGWRVTARKRFVSGSPTGDLLMTTAVDAASGPEPTVLHFALPLAAAGMSVQDNWRTLGMRGDGIARCRCRGRSRARGSGFDAAPRGQMGFTVPPDANDRAPTHRRLLSWRGRGHARPCGPMAVKRADNPGLVAILGEMDTDLAGARIAHRDMVEAAFTLEPGSDTSNRVFIDRTLVGRGCSACRRKGHGSGRRKRVLPRRRAGAVAP